MNCLGLLKDGINYRARPPWASVFFFKKALNMNDMQTPERILVIRLSAFGDIVLSLPALQALRQYYPSAHITMLTLRPFAKLFAGCPYVDQVWAIDRWSWTRPLDWFDFARDMRRRNFDAVYDLQRNDRTFLLSLLAPAVLRKKWFDAQRYDPSMLDLRDVRDLPPADLSWMLSNVERFAVPSPYVLLVPGSAPQHLQKRWPAAQFSQLAQSLFSQGYTPVLLGTEAEADTLREISSKAASALNLCGQTSLHDIASLARGAVAAIGNDTGPMHLIAAAGCPVVSLFSGTTDPAQSAPKGQKVTVLRSQEIKDIAVKDVLLAFGALKR